jgi:sterol desaturase/sphingolipid hydroxylase (fatty acid hydroxylase superfamily)
VTLARAWRIVLSPRVWFTRSTRTDVVMTVTHEMFVLPLTLAVAETASNAVVGALPRHATQAAPPSAPLLVLQSLLATLLIMLAIDLGTFLAHRLHHAVPLLWEVHAVHHSAEQLTLFTAHRLHPLEALLRAAVQGLLTGAVLLAEKAAFGRGAPLLTVWGLGAGFFVHMFTNNLLHSHVPVRYPKWLRACVLSPHIHHLHHSRSPQHQNRNFGAVFPFWDRLSGTYLDERFEIGDLRFGLEPEADPFRHSIVRCYLHPVLRPFSSLWSRSRSSSKSGTWSRRPSAS